MATRFMYKALATAALGIALSLLLAVPTTASPAWSNTAGAVQLVPPENPFAGSWSGTFSDVETGTGGTFDWTISDAGRISGTHNTTTGNSGPIVGHVGADGNLVLITSVPGDFYSGFPKRGTAVIDGDGKLVASVTGTYSGGTSLVAILERN